MQLSVSLLSLVVLVVPVLSVVAGDLTPLANIGFGGSCQGIHLIGTGANTELAATCANDGGSNNGVSTMFLNTCLGAFNGQMFCKHLGDAMDECGGCFLDGAATTILTCTCGRLNGGSDLSTIDLNECVGNNDGLLGC